MIWLAGLGGTLVFTASIESLGASDSANEFAFTGTLLSTPAKIQVNEKGVSTFDKASWKQEMQPDGTELYTFTKKPESRAAIMRSEKGLLESMTTYKISGEKSSSTEDAATLFYENGSVKAFTSCEDRGFKEIGRVCVTATPRLCKALKDGNVTPEPMKEMDGFEMRSLALLLTLRGPDHQLDNLVKSGNRLGLKSALQTTKGQLLALARQVSNEVSGRAPAQLDQKSAIDNALAQNVLERSLPRLKQACADLRFN